MKENIKKDCCQGCKNGKSGKNPLCKAKQMSLKLDAEKQNTKK
jgi:hypothetical protein